MALMIRNELFEPRQPSKFGWARINRFDIVSAMAGTVISVLILADLGGDLAAPFKLVACAFLPGWALMRHIRSVEPAARLAWTMTGSAVICGSLAAVMAWSGFWYPREVAALILLSSAISFVVFHPPRREGSQTFVRNRPAWRQSLGRRENRRTLQPWVILSLALVLWVLGLGFTRTGPLGSFGLVPDLSPLWYMSLALFVGLSIWAVASPKAVSPWFSGSAVTGLITVLYGTAPMLAEVPRFPWVYKHMAVTSLITETGHVDPLIDIYNRWPGFFSYSAFLGESLGYRSPISYAAWAEAGFALVDAVLVVALARSISNNRRFYWTTALVFTLANWVNQNYYSPQSFSYSLYLSLCLLAMTFLRSAPGRWTVALEGIARKAAKESGQRGEETWVKPAVPHQGIVVAAILVIQAVIVVSHQPTPYLAVLGLLPLFIGGYFRPRWVGVGLLCLPLLYLVPNIDYIRDKYGLFSGFNFFINAGYKAPSSNTGPLLDILLTGPGLGRVAATVLTLTVGILGIAGFFRQLRCGKVRLTLVVAWLAIAPSLGLFGQAYGGEARFRVYLFALPWLAMGVAWLFWAAPLRTGRAAALATSALLCLAMLFTFVHFQTAGQYRVSKAEVDAGQWMDTHTQPGDLVLGTRYFFPLVQGPNYAHYLTWGAVSPLSSYVKASAQDLNIYSLQAYVRHLKGGNHVYIIISDQQNERAAREHRVEAPLMPKVEAMLAEGVGVETAFDNGAVRVYKLGVGG